MPYNPQHFYSIVAALGFDQLLSFPCSIEIGGGKISPNFKVQNLKPIRTYTL